MRYNVRVLTQPRKIIMKPFRAVHNRAIHSSSWINAIWINTVRVSIIVIGLFSLTSLADNFQFFKTKPPQLQPFQSDGCSSFPDGTYHQKNLWLNCCAKHDYAYWKGGTYQQRLDADEALQDCVSNLGQPEIAFLMLAGVRIGGTPWVPTSFRWGYGWGFPRAYGELTKEELNQVERLSQAGLVKRTLAPLCESEQCN